METRETEPGLSLQLKPELFIGLVGAVGSDLGKVTQLLTQSLKAVGYSTARITHASGEDAPTAIRLAKLLRQIPKYKNLPTTPVDDYIREHMTAGDDFRKITGRDDALVLMAIEQILEEREDAEKQGTLNNRIIPGRAYILQSLKNPKELDTLREVYGEGFILLAAYSQRDARRDYLARRISESRNDPAADHYFSQAEELIERDQEEPGNPHGQNVRGIFHQADVFVDTTSMESLRASVSRFVELLFGNTFHTPSREEYGMFHAQAAALRSAEPGRQVGAAVATKEGDIVAVGVNEVPRAGGGLYWSGDNPDGREFKFVQQLEGSYTESNHKQIHSLITDTIKHLRTAGWLTASKVEMPTETLVDLVVSGGNPLIEIPAEILTRVFDYLKRAQWLSPEKTALELSDLVHQAVSGKQPAIPKSAQIRNLIEFGRAVHAEMAALMDAARRGVAVEGCTMYVTTFPCHLCARHIVAAGITRVVYIEPYAKSRTANLYLDSIAVEQEADGKICFTPFVGVAPRQFMKLFSMNHRMSKGLITLFDATKARLRYSGDLRVYLSNEDDLAATFRNILVHEGLKKGDNPK